MKQEQYFLSLGYLLAASGLFFILLLSKLAGLVMPADSQVQISLSSQYWIVLTGDHVKINLDY